MTIRVEVDDGEVLHELSRLAAGPGSSSTVFALEGALAAYFSHTQEVVHVLTGQLKATGHTTSEFTGESWTGTALYARHPGIFELARGNTPTLNHPEGGHYFFRGEGGYLDGVRAAMLGFLEGEGG